jgi:hypothetical protein
LDLSKLELEKLTKASEETRLGCQLLEKLEEDGEEIPPELSCPIKGWGVVWDPVVWADGHTYERLQLELYMRSQAAGYSVKSPVTNEVFKRAAPYQNIAIKKCVASHAVTRAREICEARNMPNTGLSDAALLKQACSAVGCSVEAPSPGKAVDPPSDDSGVEYASASPSSPTRTGVHGLRAYYETMATHAGLLGSLAREARPPERGGLTPPRLRTGTGVEDEVQSRTPVPVHRQRASRVEDNPREETFVIRTPEPLDDVVVRYPNVDRALTASVETTRAAIRGEEWVTYGAYDVDDEVDGYAEFELHADM